MAMVDGTAIPNLSDGTLVEGTVLMGTYSEKPTQGGSTYLYGQVNCGCKVQFKVWAGVCLEQMRSTDYTGKICDITGKVNEYNGNKSIIISGIVEHIGNDFREIDFLLKKYDPDTEYNTFISFISANLSPEAYSIFNEIMDPIKDRFKMEFAAVNHHDNCVSGLLAHSSKTARIAKVLKLYPTTLDAVTLDALILGAAIHDIGKVMEYYNGRVSNIGKTLNHLTLGVMMLYNHRDFIVNTKDEKFFNTLVSVIQQHHGEYGERPKTVAAFLVSLIDSLEATLTDVQEAIESTSESTICINGWYLSY